MGLDSMWGDVEVGAQLVISGIEAAGIFGAALVGLLNYRQTYKHGKAIEVIKEQTNGMTTQLQAMARREGHADGVAETEAKERT